MIKPLPLTVRWSSRQKGRVMFVVFAYHGRDTDATPQGFLERRESSAARGHRIVHRDHYANPRPLPYAISLLAAGADLLCATQPDVVIDSQWDQDIPAGLAPGCRRIERADLANAAAWSGGLLADLAAYDHVVLMYPDALGLGCAAAERVALARHGSVLVINGRRRGFRIDGSLHGRLQLRRWLAHSRIAERALAALIQPYAARLARRDREAGSDA